MYLGHNVANVCILVQTSILYFSETVVATTKDFGVSLSVSEFGECKPFNYLSVLKDLIWNLSAQH